LAGNLCKAIVQTDTGSELIDILLIVPLPCTAIRGKEQLNIVFIRGTGRRLAGRPLGIDNEFAAGPDKCPFDG